MGRRAFDDLKLKGKTVLIRNDFNVPLDNRQRITDDTRIRAALPTIKAAVKQGAKVVLMSHLGRPKGEAVPEMSLAPVAKKLGLLLRQPVAFSPKCTGPVARKAVKSLKRGQVLLLENLRYHKEETANDAVFAKKLASLCDVYVNDAFGTAHRAHASTAGIAAFVQDKAAGYLLEKEIKFLGEIVENPPTPTVAIIGGAKISGKIDVISNLLPKVDTLLIGGGMAMTFFKAMGKEIGDSLLEKEKVALAKRLLKQFTKCKADVLLPVDGVIANKFDANAKTKIVDVDKIPVGWQMLDIGPKTIALFKKKIQKSKCVLWNGPMGVFEMDKFAKGTKGVAQCLADATAKKGVISIIGGGDSAAAISQMGLKKKVTHVSTGGGASLEYLEGKYLPGIAALAQPRTLYVSGNWKMYKTNPEAVKLAKAIARKTKKGGVDVALYPAALSVSSVVDATKGSPVIVGAQNLYWEEEGAYTGELAGSMITSVGATSVLIGHSERRSYFGDTDAWVNKKVAAALKAGLLPVMCVGEELEVREAGDTSKVIAAQFKKGLDGIDITCGSQLIIAYEPVWAIGTGKVATKEQAEEVHAQIRKLIAGKFGNDVAEDMRILYGGSVKPGNTEELLSQPNIDGCLVGGASLKADSFGGIIQAANKVQRSL
jgi:triosephosphate isomerase (TIM)